MDNSKARIAINGLSDFANSFTPDDDELINEFKIEHRTLQQSMLRTIFKLIEAIASDEYATDERNKQSKDICKQMLRGFDNQLPDGVKGFKPSFWLGMI